MSDPPFPPNNRIPIQCGAQLIVSGVKRHSDCLHDSCKLYLLLESRDDLIYVNQYTTSTLRTASVFADRLKPTQSNLTV